MDTSKYRQIYLEEAETHLSGIESGLLGLSSVSATVERAATVDNLFRHFHTIKGMSASMGYEEPKLLAHALEELLSKLRADELNLTEKIVETLLDGLDSLREMVSVIEDGSGRSIGCKGLIGAIEAACEGGAGPAAKQDAKQTAGEEQGRKGPKERALEPLRLSNTMKVDSRVFDELQSTVGDLYMELSSFRTVHDTPGGIAFKDSVFSLGKTLNRLHASILTARMLPVANLTESLPRVVHDLSRRSAKEIGLKIETGEISLDRSILENLGGPLLHIIRNCVDHAVEPPDEREAAGKNRRASITVKAYPDKEHVVVEVTDDGRGINTETVKRKAIEAGYPGAELGAMNKEQLLRLVCLPGLSTARSVTDTSGRGVGMDVVKESIESIGGILSIESTEGAGTTIKMKLPRSTSIIKALFVSLFNELFLLPIPAITRVVETTAAQADAASLELDGCTLPLIRLAPALGLERKAQDADEAGTDKETKQEHCAIVIVDLGQTAYHGPALAREADGKAAIVVDDFGLEIDAFVKPLPAPMTGLRGVSGITVTGDGRPVFLIDVAEIVADALKAR